MHGSIRRRLFIQLACVAAILSMAFFLIVRELAAQAAEGTQDDILQASATSIADSLRSDPSGISLDLPYSALSMLGTISEDRVFYNVMIKGESLTGYADLPLPRSEPKLGSPVFETLTFRGDEVRAVSVVRSIGNAANPVDAIVTVAQTRLGLETISGRITTTATGIAVGFFLLATALSVLAAASAFAPIVRMTSAVSRRGPHDLRPVQSDIPAELGPLVEALNSFIARLRASLIRTEDFIAEAAHRVRTPLATVRAQAELTHRKLKNPEHKQAIREMILAIDESARSAGQMLEHAMVTFRTDSLAKETLDARVLVDETCARLGPTAEIKDIDIVQDAHANAAEVVGDPILIQAALQNILDNAIKYSPPDSHVRVITEVTNEVKISISDEGRGFAGASLSELTPRFARGGNVTDIVGSGLGLTIADEVARAHQGRLELSDNKEGLGACVSLILPKA